MELFPAADAEHFEVIKTVIDQSDLPILAKSVAEVFIVAALLIFWAAVRKTREAQKRMDDHDVEAQSHKRMTILASTLTLGALATSLILWLI